MQYVGKVGGYVYNQWNSLNPATLSGAIDIIVIQQPDGSMHCSPWHVRFGKFSIIKPSQKRIDLYVNDVKTDLPMKLGDGGEAFFVFETSSDQHLSHSVLTSPVASPASSPEISPASSPGPSDSQFDLTVTGLDLNDSNDVEEKIKLSDSAPLSPTKSPTPTPSLQSKLVFESARKVTQKLNIPSKIDYNGDMVLDMDGYKPNAQKNIDNSDEMLRKIFMEELEKLGYEQDEESKVNLWNEIIKMDKDGNIRITNIDESELIDDMYLNDPLSGDEQTMLPGSSAGDSEKTYFKTLRLTSEQLSMMDLKPGENKLMFKLNQGNSQINSNLYLWKSTTPIVISDIDGTITKSDALGHVLNFIGKDWTHEGVARLFGDIHANGYNIIYLTARSAGQADTTRQYLNSIVQENGIKLPKGPVILSPDRMMAALRREVILKKPEVFKMSCLNDIKSLYYNTSNDDKKDDTRTPFYAGFGNKITDAISYRSVHIPSHRIFTINPNGEVHMELLELSGVKSSYVAIGELVDQYFPPVAQLTTGTAPGDYSGSFSATNLNTNLTIEEKYNDVNYWREPLDLSDLTDIEDDVPEPKSPSILSMRSFGSDTEKNDKPKTRDRPTSMSSFSPLKSFMSSKQPPTAMADERQDDDDYDDDYDEDYDDDYDEDDDDDYEDDGDDYDDDEDDDYDEEDDDVDQLDLEDDLDLDDGIPRSPRSPTLVPIVSGTTKQIKSASPNSETPQQPLITKASSLLQ